ncbi:MAG: hypothetical protein FJ004_06520 [Chloroflexi bacterium]|nr:hypothetical protein [Chloroflexota bacterium]
MAHVVAAILGLVSIVLMGSDHIISKTLRINIDKTLQSALTLSTLKRTFVVAAVLATIGMTGWFTYLYQAT